jgi:hypothetical protein
MFFSQDVVRDRVLEGQLLSGMYGSLRESIEAFGYILTVRSSESPSNPDNGGFWNTNLTSRRVDDRLVWHP